MIKYSEPNEDLTTLFIWPEGVFTGFDFDEISQFKNLIEGAFLDKHLIIFGINTLDKNRGIFQ